MGEVIDFRVATILMKAGLPRRCNLFNSNADGHKMIIDYDEVEDTAIAIINECPYDNTVVFMIGRNNILYVAFQTMIHEDNVTQEDADLFEECGCEVDEDGFYNVVQVMEVSDFDDDYDFINDFYYGEGFDLYGILYEIDDSEWSIIYM